MFSFRSLILSGVFVALCAHSAGTLLASPVAEEDFIFLDENGEVVEEGFELWDAEALQEGVLASEAVRNGEALLVYDEESGQWKEVRYASMAHDVALGYAVWGGGIWAMVAPFFVPSVPGLTAGTIAKFVIITSVSLGVSFYMITRGYIGLRESGYSGN